MLDSSFLMCTILGLTSTSSLYFFVLFSTFLSLPCLSLYLSLSPFLSLSLSLARLHSNLLFLYYLSFWVYIAPNLHINRSLSLCEKRNIMGNCLRRESSEKYWAGEDWGFLATHEESDKLRKPSKMEEKSLLRREGEGCSSSTSSSSPLASTVTEVKIKIKKKQLEELLGKVDIKELSVLTRLINVGNRFDQSHQRNWSPGLQSIPEVYISRRGQELLRTDNARR